MASRIFWKTFPESESIMKLSREHVAFILESLEYTKKAFCEYQHYPGHDVRRSQLKKCDEVIMAVRALRPPKKAKK